MPANVRKKTLLLSASMVLENIIPHTLSVSKAITLLSELDEQEAPMLFVVEWDNRLIGTFDDHELRKGLANGLSLDSPVTAFLDRSFYHLHLQDYLSSASLGQSKKRWVPVLDEEERLVRLLDTTKLSALLPLDVVLMAGGKGSRLHPLTESLPKPLLKIGDQTLLEHNIDHLSQFGLTDYSISVHFLAYKISSLLGNGEDRGVNIRYVMEDHPIGTIGALGLIDEYQHDTILLMNADLLTRIDLDAFYSHFLESGAAMAVATRPYSVSLPFGVMEVDDQLAVHGVKEKPNFTYQTNAGIYLIKKELVGLVPQNQPFDATDLIDAAIAEGQHVTAFPVLDYWLDIGNMEDYTRAQTDIQFLPKRP